jgi:hypothetical protein
MGKIIVRGLPNDSGSHSCGAKNNREHDIKRRMAALHGLGLAELEIHKRKGHEDDG